MLSLVLGAALAAAQVSEPPGKGVPEALARERAEALTSVRYDLTFRIPAERAAPVRGRQRVLVVLRAPHRVVFDFASPSERVHSVRVGGRSIQPVISDDHLIVPAEATRAGENVIEVEFTAGDEALNRNDEFLYSLFVPARARFAFPAFDQPNLKARYSLTLEMPAGWQAIANGAEAARTDSGGVRFAETEPLPTYLVAFAAGKFSLETAARNGRLLRMFHRETDAGKVVRNRDAIFDLHAAALAWLEDYTGIRYPWGKFDFVLIPSFQFGGMEHAGAVFYNSASLMLDESATQNQLLNRASLISHETAHMWFGDLVTMAWFNDVWMKEVFANFMAEKIVNPSFPAVNHALRFFLGNYPAAYSIDRTAGTNPIRQPLANLEDAGQLYGAIIYQKAPIVMRQLELIVGPTSFRDGLREYLTAFSFGNATWADLIRVLDPRTPENLEQWSRAWVEERGRPELTPALQLGSDGRITQLALTMRDPMGRGLVWPQRIQVLLGYSDNVRTFPVYLSAATTTVPEAAGLPRPDVILVGGGGLAYGLLPLDEQSSRFLLGRVETLPDALTRGVGWVTLWDNLLEGRIAPRDFLDAAVRALPAETDEQNAQRVLSYVVRAYWRFLPEGERVARAPSLEAFLRAGIARVPTSSQKSAWFAAFRDTTRTSDGIAWLTRVWRREERIPGLTLAETDEIAMALEIAVRETREASLVLQEQLERTQNPDRKARFAFVIPALSADPGAREDLFRRFAQVENRRREPWVLEALAYMNHPLREAHARRFVRPGLELLQEIQSTGDIFFPIRWMDALLAGHRSPEVASEVREFLDRQRNYPERLRWTVLSSADELFRSSAIVR